jgi:hypothetical protein
MRIDDDTEVETYLAAITEMDGVFLAHIREKIKSASKS